MNKLHNRKVRFTFYFNDFTTRKFFFNPKEIDPLEMFLAGMNFNHLHHLTIEFPNYVLFYFNNIYYKITDKPSMLALRAHEVISVADNETKSYNNVLDWMEALRRGAF